MKTSKIRLAALILSMVMTLGVGISASAEVWGKAIYIYPNYVWTADYDNLDSRTGNYSSVYARCLSLFPTSGNETYKKIKCRVTNSYDLIISNTYTLNKTSNSWTTIPLYEGYLSANTVGFEFCGNSVNDANATVCYSGR
jgi:hypothetical protein